MEANRCKMDRCILHQTTLSNKMMTIKHLEYLFQYYRNYSILTYMKSYKRLKSGSIVYYFLEVDLYLFDVVLT